MVPSGVSIKLRCARMALRFPTASTQVTPQTVWRSEVQNNVVCQSHVFHRQRSAATIWQQSRSCGHRGWGRPAQAVDEIKCSLSRRRRRDSPTSKSRQRLSWILRTSMMPMAVPNITFRHSTRSAEIRVLLRNRLQTSLDATTIRAMGQYLFRLAKRGTE